MFCFVTGYIHVSLTHHTYPHTGTQARRHTNKHTVTVVAPNRKVPLKNIKILLSEHKIYELKPKLVLSSLNVKKRKSIFQWLKTRYPGIVLIQETYSSEKDEEQWTSDWGNDIIFAHGTNHSRGVAILLDAKYDYVLNEVERDLNGRYIILKVTIDNVIFVVVNIYAPTKDDTQSQKFFFEELDTNLDTYVGCNCYE